MSEQSKRKVYILDTNVLMNNRFAPYILSGNDIPDKIEQENFFEQLSKKDEEVSTNPNDIIVFDIVKRELDDVSHDKKRFDNGAYLAKTAIKTLESICEEYDINPIGDFKNLRYGSTNSYLEMDNGAKLFFLEHDEEEFMSLNYPDPKADDRIIYFSRKLQLANYKNDVEFILVSSDSNLRSDAIIRGVSVQDFEYQNVDDLNQLFTGISSHRPFDEDCLKSIISKKAFSVKSKEVEEKFGSKILNNQVIQFLDEDNSLLGYHIAKESQSYLKLVPTIAVDKLNSYINRNNSALNDSVQKTFSNVNASKNERRNELRSLLGSSSFSNSRKKKLSRKINSTNINNEKDYLHLKSQILSSTMAPSESSQSIKDNDTFNLRINPNVVPTGRQIPYYELLCDREVELLSVGGPAGTGKTYFALLSGLIQCKLGFYDNIKYFRPIVGEGNDIGYVPGDVDEKLIHWMQSAETNLREIFSGYDSTDNYVSQVNSYIEELKRTKFIDYQAITKIRGTNIKNSFVIIDEFQLLTKEEAKLVVTRASGDSKFVMVGDLDQISSNLGGNYDYVTKRNSGLAHVIDKLPGEKIYAHINMGENEIYRGKSAAAANRL